MNTCTSRRAFVVLKSECGVRPNIKGEGTAWEAARGDEFCALAGENDKFGKLPPTEFVAAAHKQAGCLRAGTFCVCACVL